jgi:hypothetical protein
MNQTLLPAIFFSPFLLAVVRAERLVRRGFQNVIRAYAFREAAVRGIRVYGQGEIPQDLGAELATHVRDATGWAAS